MTTGMEATLADNFSTSNDFNAPGNLTANRDMFLARLEVTVLASMFMVAVIGNSLALLALGLRSRKLSRMHYFILHLCISDLVVAFCHMLPQLLMDVGGGAFAGGYPGDNFLCKLVKYLALLGPCLSSYVLVATAIDRYQAICFPLMNCSWTPRRSKVMIGAAWAVSLLLSMPQVFIFSYTVALPFSHMDCWSHMSPMAEKLYILWNAVAVFIVPLLVLIFTYSCICRVIWINFQFKSAVPKPPKSGTVDKPLHLNNSNIVVGGAYRFKGKGKVEVTLYADGPKNGSGHDAGAPAKDQAQPRVHTRNGISRSKMKTVKLTVVVILCYIACSLPFFSTVLYVRVYPAPENPSIAEGPVFVLLLLLVSLNSCVNPWLYLIFNENLTKTLKDLFCCRLGKSKHHGFAAVTISRSSVSETRTCTATASPYRTQNNVCDKLNDKAIQNNATYASDISDSENSVNHLKHGNNGVAKSISPKAENGGQLCLSETNNESWNGAVITSVSAPTNGKDNGKGFDISPSDTDSDENLQESKLIDSTPAGMKNKIKNVIVATKFPKNRNWNKTQKHYCRDCKDNCNCDDV